MTDINSTTMGGGGTSTQSNSIDSKTSVLSGYSLSTSAQTIVGAINEVKLAVDNIKYPFPGEDNSYSSSLCIKIDDVEDFETLRPLFLKGIDILVYKFKYYQIFSCFWSDGYYWIYARSLTDWNTILTIEANVVNVVDTKVYQKTEDESLPTNSKTIVGAINELASKPSGVGKVDPNSDGSGEIFNSYEGGYANVASGKYSHAEGQRTTASGNYSHAEGTDTTASGNYSHTEGFRTNAFNHYEHAEGRYNVSNTGKTDDLKTRHSVGIGTSSSIRKNAHEIMFNGDHYIYGLGGYDGTNATDISVKTLQRIIEEILINTQHPVIDYSAPDSAFTGTTLINSEGISVVNVWNVENYSRTDIFLLNSSGTTTDKIRYDVVRDTQYQDFQTAHEGDNIEFDEIIQLATIVTNSFAESDLFIYHARINDEPEAKYYLVDIVMTE